MFNYTSSKGVSIETVETPLDPPLKIIIFPLITKLGGGGGGGRADLHTSNKLL